MTHNIALIGAPVDLGAGQRGCLLGPEAMRLSHIEERLTSLGHNVSDMGNISAQEVDGFNLPGNALNSDNIVGWTRALHQKSYHVMQDGYFPIFMGGDHALAMGTVSGVSQYAKDQGRPLCVLWLDAHADFNTPQTSVSGNMHGMPVSFFCGEEGFDNILPEHDAWVEPDNMFMFGIRSVDDAERKLVASRGVQVFDMRAIDEHGTATIIRSILDKVKDRNAMLHVSLDVDFLDPSIAPGVGTRVPGGANFREAHLIMEMLCESGLATSMDLAELNPYLDNQGQSARMLTDLTASLFGERILDTVTPLNLRTNH